MHIGCKRAAQIEAFHADEAAAAKKLSVRQQLELHQPAASRKQRKRADCHSCGMPMKGHKKSDCQAAQKVGLLRLLLTQRVQFLRSLLCGLAFSDAFLLVVCGSAHAFLLAHFLVMPCCIC